LRQEDKEVDGFELERDERRRETELTEDDEEELYRLDGTPDHERDQDGSGVVSAAMHQILEREHIVLNDLDLSQRELRALEALKTAVEGRDQKLNGFVFAEDRRALLEQALAVLQPELASLQQVGGESFEALVQEIAELREQLGSLEDAQEEVESHAVEAAKGEAPDTDDKADDDEREDKKDDPYLKAKPASSLGGPERKIEKPPSSLTGPERKDEPKPPTTLTGPERKDEPKPPTTLGDPKEIAAAVPPWWKRG
jgi:hypothetical protein